jgi:hypothetical protein
METLNEIPEKLCKNIQFSFTLIATYILLSTAAVVIRFGSSISTGSWCRCRLSASQNHASMRGLQTLQFDEVSISIRKWS